MGSIVITHVTPLSIEESVKLFVSFKWFYDYVAQDGDIFILHFMQDHYVFWRFEEIGTDRIIIEEQFMGKPELTTKILVEFKSSNEGTKITVTQTGDMTSGMEEEYRSDWYDLRHFGLPSPKQNWL